MIETTVKIDGMACSMCQAHVNDVIRANFSVKKVVSSYKKGEAVISSEEPLDPERLKKAISDTGYRVLDISSRSAAGGGLFSRFKK